MEYLVFFSQLFIITFGVFTGLLLAFYLVWPKIESLLLQVNAVNQSKSLWKGKMQLRFTAYERLILLINRISPEQAMLRNHNPALSIHQFKQNLISDIENEFQHNFTQQLYVSDSAWIIISKLKDDTISLFKNATGSLTEQANIDDYIAIVLKYVADLEIDPYYRAQIILKKELSA